MTKTLFKRYGGREQKLIFPHLERENKVEKKVQIIRSILSAFFNLLSAIALISSLSCTISLFFSKTPFDRFLNTLFQKQKGLSTTLFILDCSGSMKEPFYPKKQLSRCDVMKEAIIEAVTSHDQINSEQTLLGIDTFARASITKVPFTYDRNFFYRELKEISPEKEELFNGTSSGYALMKALLSIISTSILAEKQNLQPQKRPNCILISDGIEEPHPDDATDPYRSMRLIEAVQFAEKKEITVEYILIGEGWKKYSADEKIRIEQEVMKTGGHVQYIEQKKSLKEAIQSILKRSATENKLPYPTLRASFFLQLSLFCILFLTIIRAIVKAFFSLRKRRE